MKINSKGFLAVMAVVFVGIFAIMLMGSSKGTQTDKIANSMSDRLHEFRNDVKDETGDHTDAK